MFPLCCFLLWVYIYLSFALIFSPEGVVHWLLKLFISYAGYFLLFAYYETLGSKLTKCVANYVTEATGIQKIYFLQFQLLIAAWQSTLKFRRLKQEPFIIYKRFCRLIGHSWVILLLHVMFNEAAVVWRLNCAGMFKMTTAHVWQAMLTSHWFGNEQELLTSDSCSSRGFSKHFEFLLA